MRSQNNIKNSVTYTNKKANFLYNIEEKFTAGIVLFGWEAVSLMNYSFSMDSAYCVFENNNFIIVNTSITPNFNFENSITKIDPKRKRNLLLTKAELRKIKTKITQKGYTCIPLKLYRDNKYLWKLDIALVSGKNKADKRTSIKEKDIQRDLERNQY